MDSHIFSSSWRFWHQNRETRPRPLCPHRGFFAAGRYEDDYVNGNYLVFIADVKTTIYEHVFANLGGAESGGKSLLVVITDRIRKS